MTGAQLPSKQPRSLSSRFHIVAIALPWVGGIFYLLFLLNHQDELLHRPLQAESSVPPSLLQPLESSQLRAANRELKTRLDQLERKLDTYLAFDSDPFLNNKITTSCKNKSNLEEYCHKKDKGEKCGMGNMPICLDDIPKTNCVVYDFGIRNEPDFGVILAQPPFNCQVHAFDPSPITREWFEQNHELKNLPNYTIGVKFRFTNTPRPSLMAMIVTSTGRTWTSVVFISLVIKSNTNYPSGPWKVS
jgi:hypothetical protein